MAQSKNNKSRKNKIINEDIFRKSIDRKNPNRGFGDTKIQANEVGNIPEAIEHWQYEIQLRKLEILEHDKRSFIQRARDLLKNNRFMDTVTGEELTKYHPTKNNAEWVSQLKANPINHFVRLQLVSSFSKVGRSFPIEFYRSLFYLNTPNLFIISISHQAILWKSSYLSNG